MYIGANVLFRPLFFHINANFFFVFTNILLQMKPAHKYNAIWKNSFYSICHGMRSINDFESLVKIYRLSVTNNYKFFQKTSVINRHFMGAKHVADGIEYA